jgi:hypothetical protein
MGQAEGITFRNSTYGYISNERFQFTVGSSTFTVTQKLRSFDVSSYLPQYILPLDLTHFSVSNTNGTHKILWSFNSPVENVAIQHSSNGSGFADLKSYNKSGSDVLYHKPIGQTSYYRLSWKKNDGVSKYSQIVSLKNASDANISHLVLTLNGELSFLLNESESTANYSFALISTDGKLVSKTAARWFKPGLNKVRFTTTSFEHVLFVTAYNKNGSTTIPVHITK